MKWAVEMTVVVVAMEMRAVVERVALVTELWCGVLVQMLDERVMRRVFQEMEVLAILTVILLPVIVGREV